jgi:WD40 repeat protein
VGIEPGPYVGPRPFQPDEADRFFGRDRETADLFSLVIAHPAVLVYARSGAGKSSLLNAGLVPRLESEGCTVLPVARLGDLVDFETDNVYVFNVVKSWAGGDVEPERLSRLSLTEFLEGPRGRPPPRPGAREEDEEPESFSSLRIALLDQFEEIFTTHPERWRDREGFFRQLGEALEADRLLRVVIALREEYLAPLTPFVRQMPEGLRTRLHLERLREKQALAAVTGPLRQTDRQFESEDVARELVQSLMRLRVETPTGEVTEVPGEFVEPVQLQVVCERLWRELPADEQVIRREHLRDFGDVDQALGEFYEEALREAETETGIGEGKLRRWCEEVLLTPAGTRGTVYRGREETAGLVNQAVEVLERVHLVRGERRAGARWYELTHDRFLAPIQASNRRWRGRFESTGLALGRLEEEARSWMQQNQAAAALLDEAETREAERLLASPGAHELGSSEALRLLVESSRAANERKKTRRFRSLAASFLALAFIISLFGYENWRLHRREKLGRLSREAAEASKTTTDPQQRLLFAVSALRMAQDAQKLPVDGGPEEALREALRHSAGRVLDGLWGERVAGAVATPDGRWLVLRTPEGELVLRRFNRGEIARVAVRLSGFEGPIHAAAVSPDSRWVVATSGDATIRFWHRNGEAARPEILSLPDSTAEIDFLGFDAAGRWLVAVTAIDQLPHLWPLPLSDHGEPTALLSCQGGLLPTEWTAAPDLGWLITACDHRLLLWDLAAEDLEPVELAPATPEEASIWSLSVSPDGRRLAAVEENGSAFLYNLDAPKTPPEPLPPPQPDLAIVEVLFLPDGGRLLATKRKGRESGEETVSFIWPRSSAPREVVPEDSFVKAEVSPDGRVFLGAEDGGLRVLSEGREPELLRAHSHRVVDLAVSADGTWLLSRATEEPARLWDLTGQRLDDGPEPRIHRVPGGAPLTDLAVSPEGRWLVTVSESGPARLWDQTVAERTADPIRVGGSETTTRSVAFGPDGRWLVTAGAEGALRLWDLESGSSPALVDERRGPRDAIWAAVFAPDGPPRSSFHLTEEQLVDGLRSEAPDSRPVLLATGELSFLPVISSLDGRWLLTEGPGGVPHLWDVSSEAKEPLLLVRHDGGVTALAAGPDNRWLATGDGGGTVRLWDLQRKKLLNEPVETNRRNGAVTALAFSPEGRWLAAGRKDASVTLWDLSELADGQDSERYVPAVLFGHLDAVTALAFSPDGGRLASASADGTARLWTPGSEAPSGSAVTLRGHQGPVTAVAFSEDGHWLFTGGADGTARRWNLRLDELVDLACRTAGRNLKKDEWRQVFGTEPYRNTCPDLANQGSTGGE